MLKMSISARFKQPSHARTQETRPQAPKCKRQVCCQTHTRHTHLGEGAGESPESSEADALEVGERRELRRVLARDHVLNDALHRVQNRLVVAQRQHAVDLRVQQTVTATHNTITNQRDATATKTIQLK